MVMVYLSIHALMTYSFFLYINIENKDTTLPWARLPPSIRVMQGMVAVLHNELHLCDKLDKYELSKTES